MKALIQLGIVALIALITFFVRGYMANNKPTIPEKEVRVSVPLVEVVQVKAEQRTVQVIVHGRVASPHRFSLAPETSGLAIFLEDSFQEGAVLSKGSVLLRIDPRDARLALEAAQAEQEASQAALALEEASAEVAIADWRELNQGTPPVLVARTPQIAAAKARIASAKVALGQAELAHSRTTLVMPLTGRIVSRNAELGQRLDPMSPVAMIEPSGSLEVRLNLELNQLDLLGLAPDGTGAAGLQILLEADLGGRSLRWKALGLRTAADLTPSNPIVTLIASIEPAADGEALPVSGLFVSASIRGRTALLIEIPRACLDVQDRVLVVDAEQRLYHREVSVLQRTAEYALIDAGLVDGESLALSAPSVVVEGMSVRLQDSAAKPMGGK